MFEKTRFLKNSELLLLCVAFLLFLQTITGCKNNLQTMLDDFNSKFTPTEDEVIPPYPGDPDFDEKKMLFPTYYICCDGTINLAAPYSSSYNWKLISPDKELVVTKNTREFIYYLPASFYEIKAGTYRIRLEVKDEENNSYIDEATVVIYDRA